MFGLAAAILALALLRAAFRKGSHEPGHDTDASVRIANPLVIGLTFLGLLFLLLGLNQGAE